MDRSVTISRVFFLFSSRACALRLWTEKEHQSVKLEVMSAEPHCGPEGLVMHDGELMSGWMGGSIDG